LNIRIIANNWVSAPCKSPSQLNPVNTVDSIATSCQGKRLPRLHPEIRYSRQNNSNPAARCSPQTTFAKELKLLAQRSLALYEEKSKTGDRMPTSRKSELAQTGNTRCE
jgi:hypothetical protein